MRLGTYVYNPQCKGYGSVVRIPEIAVSLYLEMKVRHGRVPGVSDPGQRLTLPNPVAFADLERPVPEVRKHDEKAVVEFEDDDVPRRFRGIAH